MRAGHGAGGRKSSPAEVAIDQASTQDEQPNTITEELQASSEHISAQMNITGVLLLVSLVTLLPVVILGVLLGNRLMKQSCDDEDNFEEDGVTLEC